MLWKRVLDYSTKEFQVQAEAFVAQLRESVQPADALQGLLLDRMAASYLRKHLIIQVELAAKGYYDHSQAKKHSSNPEALKRAHVAADILVLQAQASGHFLRYERAVTRQAQVSDNHILCLPHFHAPVMAP